ncbi:DUF3298 and DUF4163 domain-containing protein [Flavivirga spongiicola]|uniref:DUF3298 and DUF4163 domain-containing protein n=1 Tax=Flavivirga spongiicola TaxID=421621 RepID=A0ABU7XSA0_9FLAO|nr:DUF3298 and DUF4163 domain-containing protein [Flavivirga sp. MEBiC05379]MDO5978649.1 DUF4163 domain-containing protein [Flavivirga sp. MEBiC05379]
MLLNNPSMFYKKPLLIVYLFFIFIACKNELNLSFSEVNISTSNNHLVEVNIPDAKGNEGIANQINLIIKKTVVALLHTGEQDSITSKSIEESITLFNKEFQTFKTDFPETAQQWEAQIDGEVMFQSSEIISIAITSYVNTGGAHGTLNISFLNFETETGNLISNDKLFKDIDGFEKVAKTYFDKTVKDKDAIFDIETFKLPANIAYNEEGVILLYNIYEIAPYSTGIIEFTIPFEKVDSLLHFNSF